MSTAACGGRSAVALIGRRGREQRLRALYACLYYGMRTRTARKRYVGGPPAIVSPWRAAAAQT